VKRQNRQQSLFHPNADPGVVAKPSLIDPIMLADEPYGDIERD
jgi:hypothetical protein